MLRRTFLALACTLPLHGTALASDGYPNKPIRLVLPFTVGGPSDIVARLIASRLSSGLGQPIVVENMGGAGGMIAAATVANAAPDGYTLFAPNASTLTIAPFLQKSTTAVAQAQSFTPISTLIQFPLVLVVHAKSPYNSLAEIVGAARATPDKVSFASPGVGTTPHLVSETLRREAKIELVHVPYKGGGQALQDLLAGQVDLFFEAPGPLMPHIRAGKLKPLAVTSRARLPLLPQLPTVSELGYPALTMESWSALVAPAGTPPGIVARLKTEIDRVLKSEELAATLRERGFQAEGSTPEQLARKIREEGDNWSRLIRERSITNH